MSENGTPEPIALRVNLLPETVSQLDMAASLTGDTRTDTINRALKLYAEIVAAVELGRGPRGIEFEHTPGVTVLLKITRVSRGRWSR